MYETRIPRWEELQSLVTKNAYREGRSAAEWWCQGVFSSRLSDIEVAKTIEIQLAECDPILMDTLPTPATYFEPDPADLDYAENYPPHCFAQKVVDWLEDYGLDEDEITGDMVRTWRDLCWDLYSDEFSKAAQRGIEEYCDFVLAEVANH